MTAPARRTDAGVAVAGLFAQSTATGGLAGRDHGIDRDRESMPADAASRVRVDVQLTEREIGFLRGLSRPSRTGGPRTLGAKFVAAGVLAAAIELVEHSAIDMHGVAAGDLTEMTARARDALLRAGANHHNPTETVAR